MKVAYFTDTYYPQLNGVTYTLSAWKEELESRGHEAHVVFPDSGYEPGRNEHTIKSLDMAPVEGYRVGVGFPADVDAALPPVDVVHAHGPFILGFLGLRLARRRDVPFFVTHHTPMEEYFRYVSEAPALQEIMGGVYTAWIRRLYGAANEVLAPSPVAAKQLAERIGREVLAVSNGTDTSFFEPTGSGFRERHGLPVDEPVVGFCGRLGYEKNLEDLIALAPRFPGTVAVAGDGFARDHYEPRMRDAGVRYLGRLDREEMPEFYSTLDVFIIPSKGETQGVCVLEANACGTPVVGADTMGLRNTIEEDRNGVRYPPGDIDALNRAVLRVFRDRARLSKGAREVGRENSVERVVDRLLNLYRGVPPDAASTDRDASAAAPMARPPP